MTKNAEQPKLLGPSDKTVARKIIDDLIDGDKGYDIFEASRSATGHYCQRHSEMNLKTATILKR